MLATPDLQELETRRDDLRQQLASIGDLRPGSLVARYRKCGKLYCRCARDGSRGHGPSWSLTRQVAGKTVTRIIPPDAVAQTQAQLAECQRLRRLAGELIEVSDALCQTRLSAERGGAAEAAKKGASRTGSRPRSTPKSKRS
jgi:hypothetical protein